MLLFKFNLLFNPCSLHLFLFGLKLSPAAYIQVHFKLDFVMESNNIDPDQTAPKEQSELGQYGLQYRPP